MILRFRVENIGRTIARDVSISFDPGFVAAIDESNRVADVPILATGVASMAPGRSYTFIADHAPHRKSLALPDRYVVTIEYTGPDGVHYSDSQVVDFGVIWNTPDLREEDIHDGVS